MFGTVEFWYNLKMNESIERIQSGREILKNLEELNIYVFHGSENPGISVLEPRQAYTRIAGAKVEDDKPAIHASPLSDIAILMALVNINNCPNGFNSGFERRGEKLVLCCSQQGLDQLNENSRGYIYVLSKDDFIPRGKSQAISYTGSKPLRVVEVRKEDLSEDLEIREPEV